MTLVTTKPLTAPRSTTKAAGTFFFQAAYDQDATDRTLVQIPDRIVLVDGRMPSTDFPPGVYRVKREINGADPVSRREWRTFTVPTSVPSVGAVDNACNLYDLIGQVTDYPVPMNIVDRVTAAVKSAILDGVAPEYDTLRELAAKLGADDEVTATILSSLGQKAPLDRAIPTGGTAGQVVTKTQGGFGWVDSPAGSGGTPADGSITAAKLAAPVQTSLGRADLAATKITRPTGISRWDYFQTVRNTRKLVGVAWGTSSYEGTGASSPSQRIPSRLEDMLQALINPAGVPGGYTVPIAIDTSLFTGTQSGTSTAGFSSQSRSLATGAAITHAAAATTGFDLYFEAAASSSITVSIDGGAAETVTTTAQGVWSSAGLTRGAHTIAITGNAGTAIVNTLYVRDGDETTGIRLFINAQSGQTASAFVSSTTVSSRLASLKPDFHIIQLNANDYTLQVPIETFKTNLRAIVSKIVTAQGSSAAPWIAFVSALEKRTAPLTIPMQAYRDATEQVAAEYPDFASYHDTSGAFPKYGTPDPLVLVGADDTHPTTIGHRLSADLLMRSFVGLQNLRVTPTSTVATAPTLTSGTAPAGKVGAAYSFSYTASGSTPLTWSVSAGSLPAGLTLDANTGVLSGTPTAAGAASFTVTATNGAGFASVAVSLVIAAATVPGAPTNLVLTAGDGKITASMSAPTDNGGSALTDFVYQHSTDQSTWTTFADGVSAATGAVITSLPNGTGRYVRAAAVNAIGQGPYVTAGPVTPTAASDTTAPTVPGTPVLTAGNGSISSAFSGSTDSGGSGLAGYRMYGSADGYTTPIQTGSGSPMSVSSPNGTAVSVKMTAYDAAGNESAKSAVSNTVTPAAPSAITDGFTGADVANLSGRTTESGGKTWVASGTGVMGIVGGKVAITTPATSTDLAIDVIDSGSADGTIKARLDTIGSTTTNTNGGIVLRYVDDSNYLLLAMRTASTNRTWALLKRVGGTNTTVFSTGLTHAANDVAEAHMTGAAITLVINGVSQTAQTVTEFATATKHGLRLGGDSLAKWDDFSASTTP